MNVEHQNEVQVKLIDTSAPRKSSDASSGQVSDAIEIEEWSQPDKKHKKKYESSKTDSKGKEESSVKSTAHSWFSSIMRQEKEVVIDDLWKLLDENLN